MSETEIKTILLGFVSANENALVAYICLREQIEGREIAIDDAIAQAREIRLWLDAEVCRLQKGQTSEP